MTLSIALVLLLVVAAMCGAAGVLRRSRAFGIAAGLIVVMVALVAGAIAFTVSAAPAGQSSSTASPSVEFVGTTPCDEPVRAFVGGIEPGAACHAVTWRLTLNESASGGGKFSLDAKYGVPPPGNPNQMVDGPRVSRQGPILKATPEAYTLLPSASASARQLRLTRISNDLLHLQASSGALMVGNGGWSYTLNRRERTEQPGDPATAGDFSYKISPRSTGSTVFGLFEGRTPCRGIAQDLGLGEVPGCIKAKWRVTLYQDAATGAPARYKIESTLHRQQPREGTWRIAKGAAGQAGAVVYELGAAGKEAPILLMKGDDNVLFFLNQQRQMLVGSIDFGYTLNRVTESPR